MVSFSKEQITPFTHEQMFALVNDVANYSQFLPGCTSSQVLTKTEDELTAELTLNIGPITQVFATKNYLNYPHHIRMTKLYGPFKTLEGGWTFKPLAEHSVISLNLEYEFNNKITATLLAPLFSNVTKSMIHAFVQRAHQVYR